MRIDVVTIFPDYLAPLRLSLIGRAVAEGVIDLRVHDLRSFTSDRHRTVDDTPYGGGPGMLMRPEPWGAALDEILPLPPSHATDLETTRPPGPGEPPRDPVGGGGDSDPLVVVPTPSGRQFTQAMAHELAAEPWLVFVCGRYEGVDQRVIEEIADRARLVEISLGDYVLGGGEVAVLVIVEAVGRLLPGVIGNADSLVQESHSAGLLEGPGYTKPPTWRGRRVPDVLLSGDHARIARWRREQALRRTAARRPDLLRLLDPDHLDRRDLTVLAELGWGPDHEGRLTRTPGLAQPEPPVAD